MSIIREPLIDLKRGDVLTNDSIVSDMLKYFDRQNDTDTIKGGINSRYAVGIKQVTDPANSSRTIETYVKEDMKLKVDSGLIEAISTGFGQKVVNALATLTTEPGHKFTLRHDQLEGDQLKEAEELLLENRVNGGFETTLVDADRMSVQVGSSAVLLTYSGSTVKYQVVAPSSVRAFFAETVTENEMERSADTKDIEDASVVIIKLDQVDLQVWNYLAIYGRSDIYPLGRYVTYKAAAGSTEIPAVGSIDANDYRGENGTGEVQNPLSVVALENPELALPEYPIGIILGGTTKSASLLPISTSLYHDSVEFDVASSHLLSISQEQARGARVVEVSEQGANQPLPRTLSGYIVAQIGQKVVDFPGNASGSADAMKVKRDLAIDLAAGYSVPDYMVVSEDYTVDASSGIALAVKTRPLKKNREYRIGLNSLQIKKIFDIEKCLIVAHDQDVDDKTAKVLLESTQVWDAGELTLPENKKESAERIKLLGEIGVLDMIAQIREYFQLPTEAEAIEVYEKYRGRATEYPPLRFLPEPGNEGGEFDE
jgi:hypothetical protein